MSTPSVVRFGLFGPFALIGASVSPAGPLGQALIRMSRGETRDRILRAALEVFARKGYHRAVVDDIVRASRTSKGAVYHHFPNKEALFLALVDEFSARLAEAVATAVEGSHGALGKVEAALRAGLLTFARHRELARIILLESVSLGSAYEAKRAEVHRRFAALIQAYLDQAMAEGSIPPVDTRVATLAWLELVIDLKTARAEDREDPWADCPAAAPGRA